MIAPSISHYRILRRLGAGGMGEVYEAEDTQLQRKVALKILPEDLAAKPETLDRFKREALALAALNHPHIVTIYSVEHADTTHFLSMELVEGRPLSELIPQGGLDLENIFALGIPLADALAAAHARGIGHRDLKPSNVMVNDQGQIKVIDFGLAKRLHPDSGRADLEAVTLQQTVEGHILGTPAYMSPEQIEGRHVDHRTDIFSLGILLFEMATSQRPFSGDSAMSLMSSILRDPPSTLNDLKPELPGELGRIIHRCLHKNPDARYPSALEVRNELNRLQEQIRRNPAPATAVGSEGSPPFARPIPVPNNLPAHLTSFIGRERETSEVTRLLAGDSSSATSGIRLLTLTGPGGTGKTRLAQQVAARLLDQFRDGVWLVELAALSNPSMVPEMTISAMGLVNAAGLQPLELLTRVLGPKHTLLVLDNCEHLVDACADFAQALLKACPRLQILATSREVLRLPGEMPWPVPSFSLPSLLDGQLEHRDLGALAQYESIELFIERARTVAPAFELTELNAAAVVQLCHRLDGIPLAIELAAARLRLLSVEQLVHRVKDRFQLLTGGSRTALPRQQTLRALVDWSYDLLSDQERLLFDRLSVFAGGWTTEAAEAVCADDQHEGEIAAPRAKDRVRSTDILELLDHLLEKSMIVNERSTRSGPRFRLLETLRQYGHDRLAQRGQATADALRKRHAAYFIALAEEAALGMRGPDQVRWPAQLEIEHDNIRAGIEWGKAPEATADRVELVMRFAGPLYALWFRRGHGREIRKHFETLLAHPAAQRPTRARAAALYVVGSLAFWQDGDEKTAFMMLTESLNLAQQLDDTRGMADARHNLGIVVFNQGDKAAARHHHEEALRLSRQDGDAYGIRWALEDLADLAADAGNNEGALRLQEEALTVARQTGDQHGIASTLQSMGVMARGAGDTMRAQMLMGEGLNIMQQIGCLNCSALYLADLAFLANASQDSERAVQLLGAADALRERTGIVASTAVLGRIDLGLAEARQLLGESLFARAWSLGRSMSLAEATALALNTTS